MWLKKSNRKCLMLELQPFESRDVHLSFLRKVNEG